MRPVATVVAFGPASAQAVAGLDTTALCSDIVLSGTEIWTALKQRNAGSFLLLLAEGTDAASLAEACEAAKILGRLGGGPAIVIFPPGRVSHERLARVADSLRLCVLQPAGGATQADAVRGFVEPLSIFGLVGVDAGDFHALAAKGRCGEVHLWQPGALAQELRAPLAEVLLTYRMRPEARLDEIDAAASEINAQTQARLVFAGPEVPAGDSGPRAIATLMLR